jgi:RHS repeat-associated protein
MKETNPDPQNYEGDYNPLWEFYFYGITGQKLVTVDCNNPNGNGVPSCWVVGQNVYFGSKLLVSNGVYVVTDRLGSVRANTQGPEYFSYYPYGEERTVTADGGEKFGTYFRDSVGQDYAGQRYYNGGMGRFWNPDSAGIAAANPSSPASWNGYAYTKGDPVNRADPSGMFGSDPPTAQHCIDDPDDPACYGPCGTGGLPTVSQGLFRVLHPEFAMDAGCGPEPEPVGPPSDPPPPPTCASVLTQNLQSFLVANDAAALKWDPSLAADLVAEGAAVNVDPRLMASILTLESGHGGSFGGNNPFGLGPGNTYGSSSAAIQSEGKTLNQFIYKWGETTVSELYSGNNWVTTGRWHEITVTYPGYCSEAGGGAAAKAACQAAGVTVAGFLTSQPGNASVGLSAGKANSLGYPCDK